MTSMAAERESELFYLAIPCGSSEALSATWGLGNQLYVYPEGRQETLSQNRQQGEGTSAAEVSHIRWHTEMHGPITRKLVNESHNIFVMLQGQVNSLSGTALHTQLVKASKQYRSVLKACSMELLHLTDTTQDEHQRAYYENQLQMFEMIQLIWSLCEILFVDTSSDGLVLRQLLDWLRWHFSEGKRLAMEVHRDEQPDSHPMYWDAIYRLTLQGEAESVRRLLSQHSSANSSDAFAVMDELLRKMPQAHQYNHIPSAAEYDMKWRHWREECVRVLEEGQFAAFTNLETLAQILCGDDAIFTEMKDYCETWYHLLVSKMLYQNPTIKSLDLHFHVQSCMEEFCHVGARMGELDNILQAAIEFDIHQVIKDSSAFLSTGNWWFVSHLTDILHHCGQLDTHNLAFGSNLREFLLLEYASTLMSHKSLWQVGVDYLDCCPVFGSKYLELYIERIPLETEKKAQKVLHICEERNMMDQAQSICKLMGMKSYRNGRLGSALSWFLQSKDVAAATRLTEKFLLEYGERGQFSHLDLLDNLGSSMLLSNRLTFLGKYREFQKLYEDHDFDGAGSLLLSLLSARLAPKNFWITLLMDAMPLLEAPKVIFSSSKTYEMMHCLEELTQELIRGDNSQYSTAKGLTDVENERLELLRLTLTRNLSRAIIHEGTITPS
ncbi:nuclear pore complex protein Nup85-like [Haliotis rubra]|uniref:nuclear pore complex protein Nup85-like n=1 Tax=Haliotis rubra TaxID=36100 RepID=UPI001EE60F03|nr:nuclear pore complex protein Nup85-like [Haliotis rubra]